MPTDITRNGKSSVVRNGAGKEGKQRCQRAANGVERARAWMTGAKPSIRDYADRAALRQRLDHADGGRLEQDAGRGDPDRLDRAGPGARRRRRPARPDHRDLRPGIVAARRRSATTSSPRRRRSAASRPSWMPSTRSIRSMRASCGVNIDNLSISQPDTGEQALEITETLVRSGAIDVVVVDSVAALVPRAEIDGDMGDAHVGLQARLMSPGAPQADRRDQPLADLASSSRTSCA